MLYDRLIITSKPRQRNWYNDYVHNQIYIDLDRSERESNPDLLQHIWEKSDWATSIWAAGVVCLLFKHFYIFLHLGWNTQLTDGRNTKYRTLLQYNTKPHNCVCTTGNKTTTLTTTGKICALFFTRLDRSRLTNRDRSRFDYERKRYSPRDRYQHRETQTSIHRQTMEHKL